MNGLCEPRGVCEMRGVGCFFAQGNEVEEAEGIGPVPEAEEVRMVV